MRCLPVVILAFVATTLATDNKNYDELPMDYLDEIGPDSTFTFRFEQKRRDQPSSQIEMREENVGRYFHTKAQTTTPASIFSMKADKESQHVYPAEVSTRNQHPPRGRWIQRPKTIVPRPPSIPPRPPHLTIPPSVYRNLMNSQPLQQTEPSSTASPNLPSPSTNPVNANNVTPKVASIPTPSQPTPGTESPITQSSRSSNFVSRHPNKPDGIQFSPSASYVSDSISSNNAPHPPARRGRPRFRWGERTKQNSPVVALNEDSQISSTPQSGHSNEPDSVQSSPSTDPIISNSVTPILPRIPTPSQQTLQTEPPKIQSTRSPNFPSRHPNKPDGIQFSPSASYVSDSISSNDAPHPPARRGRPRFRWGERTKQNSPVVALDQDSQISSTPQSGHSNEPDSVQSSPATNPIISNNVTPNIPSIPTPSQPTPRTEFPRVQSTRSPGFASRHQNKPDAIQFSPSASYVSDSISSNNASHPPARRGRPRFRWGERTKQNSPVVALDQDSQISSTPQSGHSNEPDSVQSSPSTDPIISNNVTPILPHIPTPSQQTLQTEPPKIQSSRSPNFPSRHPNKPDGIQFSPSASYVSDSISSNDAPHPPARRRERPMFRWGERTKQNSPVVALDQDSQISSTPQSIQKKPPPPVPTLSPWYDNFGK